MSIDFRPVAQRYYKELKYRPRLPSGSNKGEHPNFGNHCSVFLQCLFKFVNSCFNIITKELQNGAKRRDRDRSCCQRMSPCTALQYKGLYRFYVTQSSSFLICVSTTVYSLIKPYTEDITKPLGDTKFLFEC